jgi:riboflavin synthase
MAFPGFRYRELLGMDFRDRVVWESLATRALAQRELMSLMSAGMPYMDETARSQYIDALVEAAEDREPKTAEEIEAEKRAEHEANLMALKRKVGTGRRRKRGKRRG